MSAAPVEPLPDGRCPLCGARNRDDAQWCVQCLVRFGVADAPHETPRHEAPRAEEAEDGRSGSRRGASPLADDDDLAGALPRPRRDRDRDGDDSAAGPRHLGDQGRPDRGPLGVDDAGLLGVDDETNRLMAQLRAHEAQRLWGSAAVRRLGLTGRPWLRAAVGAVVVFVVLLVGMWMLGHFV